MLNVQHTCTVIVKQQSILGSFQKCDIYKNAEPLVALDSEIRQIGKQAAKKLNKTKGN